ncbi:MAG: hypothetical protein ACLPUO_24855 [Streptosporangiaceae bacterium]|jgi:hypothetical protein
MPARENAPAGAPCWVDLTTSDTGRSREFYTRLFGWTAEEPAEEFGGYFSFRKDGVPGTWSAYLASSDAQKTSRAPATAAAASSCRR